LRPFCCAPRGARRAKSDSGPTKASRRRRGCQRPVACPGGQGSAQASQGPVGINRQAKCFQRFWSRRARSRGDCPPCYFLVYRSDRWRNLNGRPRRSHFLDRIRTEAPICRFLIKKLALLDAIQADPKSDALRVDYAKWLESQGDSSTACLIQLQLSGDGDYTLEWLREHGRRWASPKPMALTNLFYRRGLPEAHLAHDHDPPQLKKMSPRSRDCNAAVLQQRCPPHLWPTRSTR
jgi:uncharacterized protein (TIGR02996 family)